MADSPPVWLSDWEGDGIIARVETRSLEKALIAKALPTIDLRGKYDLAFPLIETDDRKVCELAAEHLVNRGFRHFAYCGFAGTNYSERRLRYFPPVVGEAGYSCHVYPEPGSAIKGSQKDRELDGILYEDDIVRWIESLPRPVGIMACNDIRGQQVLNACRAIGIEVPDEVAVVGVDNDELLCELSDPPLSSVEPNTERIGFEAAALLDRMMNGEKVSDKKHFVDPKHVVTRLSTDVIAMEDREIAGAVRYIRQHACDGINVEDVLENVALSRSALDRRFAAALGRSPKAEIVRIQINRVKQLLMETDFTLAAIAKMAGFRHAEYMSNVFKQKIAVTPGEFRKSSSA